MDVLVYKLENGVELYVRSLGPVFDPHTMEPGDMKTNMEILLGVASEIDNQFAMGMNTSRLLIERS